MSNGDGKSDGKVTLDSANEEGAVATEATEARRATLVRAALSDLLGRREFAQRAGLQYGTKRDIYKVAGYERDPDFNDYWAAYERGDIAGRIVDMPPQTTWRLPPEIVEPDAPEGTEFTEAVTDLAKRLRLWHYFERVDRLAGVGRYAVLLLGVRGALDSELSEPLTEMPGGPEDLLYLAVASEPRAKIQTWERDTGEERFGLPLLYRLDLSDKDTGFKMPEVKVHSSRVLHIAEDKLLNEVFGRPRLQRVLNRLFDLDKVSASTGEAFWQTAARILVGRVDPEADISNTHLKELGEDLEEIIHDLRRQFLGDGIDLEWLDSTPPDPKGAADLYMTLIAAAAGIPKRMLFGSETGERASTEDQKTWLGTIGERQERFAEPDIVREFIDRLVDLGGLPAPASGEYEVQWPHLFKETDKEIAEANKARAETAKALTPLGGSPLDLVEIDDERNVWLIPRAIEEAMEPEEPEEPEEGEPDVEEEEAVEPEEEPETEEEA